VLYDYIEGMIEQSQMLFISKLTIRWPPAMDALGLLGLSIHIFSQCCRSEWIFG